MFTKIESAPKASAPVQSCTQHVPWTETCTRSKPAWHSTSPCYWSPRAAGRCGKALRSQWDASMGRGPARAPRDLAVFELAMWTNPLKQLGEVVLTHFCHNVAWLSWNACMPPQPLGTDTGKMQHLRNQTRTRLASPLSGTSTHRLLSGICCLLRCLAARSCAGHSATRATVASCQCRLKAPCPRSTVLMIFPLAGATQPLLQRSSSPLGLMALMM